ncbi:hypothetical protein ABIA32_003836 [Streptacidiphilus sp. MAP12-20]|uniref:hypothetical protein n=1 Tax=Streptacidiphilus sp. MAP12-20 TaxID=3156299 RepID=UPI003517E618
MNLVKRLATATAALGLASAGVIGLSTSAHATGGADYTTVYGAHVSTSSFRSGSYEYVSWNIDTSGSRTDERMYFEIICNGQVVWSKSVNDWYDHDNVDSGPWIYCNGNVYAHTFTTESGIGIEPLTVYDY